MARYIGPRAKRTRRLNIALTHLTSKSPDKDPSLRKPYPPGQHGPTGRGRVTPYGQRLLEKQKLKVAYELMEHTCRRYVARAKHSGGNAALMLTLLIESRFDCLVWRAGFATSIRQARQFIRHGYFRVNGEKMNLPGAELRPGSVVTFVDRFTQHPLIQGVVERTRSRVLPTHLRRSEGPLGFTVVRKPEDVEPPVPIDTFKVIELYA